MTDRTPEKWWDDDHDVPEPGVVEDPTHGLGGEAEPLPDGDAERDEDMS